MQCTRAGCSEKAHTKMGQNTVWCVLHAKVYKAIVVARRTNRFAPDYDVLLKMFVDTKNCPICGIALNPHIERKRTDSRRDMATLQHNPDGTLAIWCSPCNVREGQHELRVGFKDIVGKRCPTCKLDLPLDMFTNCKRGLHGKDTYCRKCKYKKHPRNADGTRWEKYIGRRLRNSERDRRENNNMGKT